MKPFPVSKFTSIVMLLIVSLVIPARAQNGFYSPPTSNEQALCSKTQGEEAYTLCMNKAIYGGQCSTKQGEASTAFAEAMSACQSARRTVKKSASIRQWTCGEAIEQCEDSEDEEQALTLTGQIFQLGGGTGEDCDALGDITGSDFRSEKRDLEQTKRDAKRDKLAAEEKKIKGEEDYQRDVKDIQKETQALLDEASNKKKEDEDNDRKNTQEEQASLQGIKAGIRKGENGIMAIEAAQLRLPKERQSQIIQYNADLTKCRIDVQMAAADKTKFAPTQSRGGLSGSLINAGKAIASRMKLLNEMWENCAQAVITRRSNDEATYNATVTRLGKELQDATAELAEMKQNLELFKTQQTEAAASKEQEKARLAVSNLAKYNEFKRQQEQIDSNMMQKRYLNQQDIAAATTDMNKASNDLKNYGNSRKPGTKTKSEAEASILKFAGAVETCQYVCTLANATGAKCDPSSGTSSGTPGGVNGQATDQQP